ncbi:MAG: AsmA family protein [Marinicaulis sp.]|nr:AsmA family protein [Marinicaulis sp.]
MGRILFYLIALIAVLIAVVVFIPGVIPVASFKDQIEARASEAVGRDVTIGDDISFRLLPRTAFRVNDLTIANAEGFDGDTLVTVNEADIGFGVIPFIMTRSVEVDRFVLSNPEFNFVRKNDGAANWNLSRAGAPAETGNSAPAFRDISLGDVRIVDGKASFRDLAADTTYSFDEINVAMILNSLTEPFELDGTMNFQGSPATLDLVLTSFEQISNGEVANLKYDVQVGETVASGDLSVNFKDAPTYSGPIKFNAPNLTAFAKLVGVTFSDAPGFDQLSFSGNVDGNDAGLRLSNADIGFDEIEAEGVFNLDWTGARPKASGVLSTDKLDLRPYMPPPVEGRQGFPEWSTTPMNFTSLRNVDAEFDISTNAIYFNDLEIGESRVIMRIDNGRLTADVPELAMYGGQGSGRLVVNARGQTPSFSGNLDMGAVNAQPLSLDLLKHDNILGLGSLQFDFSASGASQAAIMSSLDGNGGFDLADGALKGVNMVKMVRAVGAFQEGFNPAALANAVTTARGPDEQTDFSEFLSNFTITDGLLNAPTIRLSNQFLNMTGNGNIDLPRQAIDLRLNPVASTGGENARQISAPVRVGGTFSKPTVGIDPEALLTGNPQETLRGIIGGLGGNRDESEPADGAEDEEQETSPEGEALKAIEGLFGKPKNDDGAGGANQEASAEEEIANTAINALFGAIKKNEEKKEENPDN